MNLKSLRFGIRYSAWLMEKYCWGASFFLWCTRAPKLYSRCTKYCAPKFQILRVLQVKITFRSNTFLCRRISFLSRLIFKNVFNSHSYQVQDITQEEVHFYSSQLSNNILREIFHSLRRVWHDISNGKKIKKG